LLVYIVRISGTTADFRERLPVIDDAALVRELPPDRVVVTLASSADVPRLTALEGVESVTRDRLERRL